MSLVSADYLRPYKIFNDWLWYYYSVLGIVPLFSMIIYKYRTCLEWKHYSDKPLPSGWLQDRICDVFMYGAWVYYLLDCLFTLLSFSFNDQCRFHLWFHHLICIFALPVVFSLGYYPWFILTLPAHHALLIYYPDCEFLNFMYAVYILTFQYNAFSEHFKKRRFIFVLYIPLFGMWYGECKNYIPDYTF